MNKKNSSLTNIEQDTLQNRIFGDEEFDATTTE
jgi:hypothetical protein